MAVENIGHPSLMNNLNVNVNLQTQETTDIQNNNLAIWTADKLIFWETRGDFCYKWHSIWLFRHFLFWLFKNLSEEKCFTGKVSWLSINLQKPQNFSTLNELGLYGIQLYFSLLQ